MDDKNSLQPYKFMFIGFGSPSHKDFKAELVSNIISLGGIYVENEKYNDNCSHFICMKPWPCDIQKFLGACATGKWVLTPEYIQDSNKNWKWLAERDYEWGATKKATIAHIHPDLPDWVKTAPKRNRMRKLVRHKLNAGLPFKKWTACVVNYDKIKRVAYEDILKFGGAKLKSFIYNGSQDPGFEQSMLLTSHVFSENTPDNVDFISDIEKIGVKCLSIDYIRDYILKNEKPKEEDYEISTYTNNILKAPRKDSFKAFKLNLKMLRLRLERHKVQNWTARYEEREISYKPVVLSPKTARRPKNDGYRKRKSRKLKRIKSSDDAVSGIEVDPSDADDSISGISPSPNLSKNLSVEEPIISATVKKQIVRSRKNLSAEYPDILHSPKMSPRGRKNSNTESVKSIDVKMQSARNRKNKYEISEGTEDQTVTKYKSPRIMKNMKSAILDTVPSENSKSPPVKMKFQRISKGHSSVEQADDIFTSIPPKYEFEEIPVSDKEATMKEQIGESPTHETSLYARPFNLDMTTSLNESVELAKEGYKSSSSKPRKRGSRDSSKSTPPKRTRKKAPSRKKQDEDSFDESHDVEGCRTGSETSSIPVSLNLQTSLEQQTDVQYQTFSPESSSTKETSMDKSAFGSVQTMSHMSEDSKSETQTSSSEEPFSPENMDVSNFEVEAMDPLLERIKKTFPNIYLWETKYQKQSKKSLFFPSNARSASDVEMPSAIAELFYTCIDQYKLEHAIDFFISVSAHTWYPHPKVLNKIIQFIILNPDDVNSTDKASMLFNAISSNQPALSPSLSDAYVKALCPCSMGFSPWNTLAEIISSCILNQVNCHILLNFYIDIFTQDFEAFLRRSTNPSSDLCMKRVTCPVLVQIFWSTTAVGTISKPLEELLLFIYQAVVENDASEAFNNLLTMLSLVAECTRLAESNSLTLGIMAFKSKELARNVFEKCKLVDLDNSELYKFLCALKPSWLQAQVISEIIVKLPFVTFSQKRTAEPLSLSKILDCYMKPVDKIVSREATDQGLRTKKKTECDSPLKSSVINRRNRKGETQVHVACMENQPLKLKRLLDVPGVDVNIRDYAGWTPLHEACNRGFLECVSLLLKHNPGNKNVTQRLKKDPVDLIAKSNDGTTPMHDAVVNDHIEVVNSLLNKAGLGLLNVKSNNGVTPLDLIKSSKMKELIKSFTERNQELKLTKEDKENVVPVEQDPYLESELLELQVNEISWFITLLRLLIRSYLETTKLKQVEKGLKNVLEFAQKDPTFENMTEVLEDCLKYMKDHKVSPKEVTAYSNDLMSYLDFKKEVQQCKTNIIKLASEKNKEESENEFELLLILL